MILSILSLCLPNSMVFKGVHWGVMTLWIIIQRTDFCPSMCEEALFNAVVGVVYIFCYFNLKEGRTRWRVLIYYVIAFFENTLLVGLWLAPWKSSIVDWHQLMIICAVYGSFTIG